MKTRIKIHGFAQGNVLEALRKHLGLDFLHGNNFFHPKQLKCMGVRDIWNSLPSPIYRKRGEEVAAQLAQVSWVASSLSNPASKMFWKGPDSKI